MTAAFYVILSLVTAFSIWAAVFFFLQYKSLKEETDKMVSIVKKKYVKVDPVMHNAILEAYEQAKKKGNDFEAKKYKELNDKIKSKW